MIDLGNPSDDTAAITYARPGERRSFAERLADEVKSASAFSAGMPDSFEDAPFAKAQSELLSAAAEQTRLAQTSSGRMEAMADAADRRIETVQQVTGVQLKNPFRQGYYIEAQRRYDDARGRGEDPGPRADYVGREMRNIFTEKLDDAAQRHPDQAAALQFYQPIEAQAGAIATNAEARAALASRGYQAAGGGIASEFFTDVVGGLWGSRRDPIAVTSLFAGPAGAVGRTMLSRVATAALTQGFFNLGIQALERPDVRAWRTERGQDPGSALPSPAEVGIAFAMGAIPGAGIQTIIEAKAAAALRRVVAGEASRADIQDASRAMGVRLDDDMLATLRAGQRANAAIDAGREPAHASPGAAELAEAQGLRHDADPVNEPPPPLLRSVPEGTTDAAAVAHLEASAAPLPALEAMRGDPALIHSALASDRPDVLVMGKLASLSDEAWSRVRDRQATAEHGVVVADYVANPADHAAVLDRVTAGQPLDAREARLIAADAAEQIAARRSADELDARLATTVAVKPKAARGRAAADPGTWSLFELLASEGGLRPDGELRAIFGSARGPFVPGFGPLVRPGGRGLDDALRLAKDHGYLFDPGDVTGDQLRVGINDLLDRMAEESAGRKSYRWDKASAEDRAAADRQAREIVRSLRSEIEKTSGEKGIEIDKALEDRVVQIMTREGEHDVHAAYERAIMEDAERYETARGGRTQNQQIADIPGWDTGPLPADTGAAPRDGTASPGRRGDERLPDQGTGGADGAQPRDHGAADRSADQGEVAPPDWPALRESMDSLPIARDDGTVVMASREVAAAAGERETGFADLVRSCK